MLIYHQLTKRFNTGRLRAVMCSGQAVVMHRLAQYKAASESWEATWPALANEISSLPLPAAHQCLVAEAHNNLPQQP